jgi:acetyltransferase-like isoleucine patch superfamily enzyme
MPIVSMVAGSTVRIGDRVVLCSDSRFTALGVNHPVTIRTLNRNAVISIGADSGISGGSICAASHVEIGNECLLGANVLISDTDFHPIKPRKRRFNTDLEDIATAPVTVESNVFIGSNATLLKGVRVGKNSVVGANAVVTKSFAENSIIVGNPGRSIRRLNEELLHSTDQA